MFNMTNIPQYSTAGPFKNITGISRNFGAFGRNWDNIENNLSKKSA